MKSCTGKNLDKNEIADTWWKGEKKEKRNAFCSVLRQAGRSIDVATIRLPLLCSSGKTTLNNMKHIQDDPAHLMF